MSLALTDKQLEVENYKVKQFLRLGFSIYETCIAIDEDRDWHKVEKLIDKGCDPALALRIA